MSDVIETKYCFYSEVPIPDELRKMLIPSEKALFAVKTIRDVAVFTDKRIFICDKQGLTGKKKEYCTIPYKSIVTYAIETAGMLDLDAEIELKLQGGIPIKFEFLKDPKMNELLFKVYETITNYIFAA